MDDLAFHARTALNDCLLADGPDEIEAVILSLQDNDGHARALKYYIQDLVALVRDEDACLVRDRLDTLVLDYESLIMMRLVVCRELAQASSLIASQVETQERGLLLREVNGRIAHLARLATNDGHGLRNRANSLKSELSWLRQRRSEGPYEAVTLREPAQLLETAHELDLAVRGRADLALRASLPLIGQER